MLFCSWFILLGLFLPSFPDCYTRSGLFVLLVFTKNIVLESYKDLINAFLDVTFYNNTLHNLYQSSSSNMHISDISLDTNTRVRAFSLMSDASIISWISSTVGILSRAYLLARGRTHLIFFQFRDMSFISKSNLTALRQFLAVAVVISPL